MIGVPSLNQKAREVPPEYKSLTSTGVYLLITKKNAHFWIGLDFFESYLDDNTYKSVHRLISDSLFKRLISLYNSINEDFDD